MLATQPRRAPRSDAGHPRQPCVAWQGEPRTSGRRSQSWTANSLSLWAKSLRLPVPLSPWAQTRRARSWLRLGTILIASDPRRPSLGCAEWRQSPPHQGNQPTSLARRRGSIGQPGPARQRHCAHALLRAHACLRGPTDKRRALDTRDHPLSQALSRSGDVPGAPRRLWRPRRVDLI